MRKFIAFVSIVTLVAAVNVCGFVVAFGPYLAR